MQFAQTAIRYLQRRGFFATQLNYSRFQMTFLKTHQRPVGIPIVPKNTKNINNEVTKVWPTDVG